MIELMDLRAGNYIHPPLVTDKTQPDTERYLRIISLNLLTKKVNTKEDSRTEIEEYDAREIFGCSIAGLSKLMGGFSFNEHSILIKGEGEVFIIHEDGSSIILPHVHYLHQFQNLFRSLTGQEFPFNIGK